MCRLGTNSGREAPFMSERSRTIQIEISIITNSLVTNCKCHEL